MSETASDILEELKNNPIFNMSLHSKELFHSNFWAWLFEHNVKYVKIFFPEIEKCESIEREQGHRDITIWSGGAAYIIENKFKSIPELQQIEEYQGKLDNKFAGGVLTGIKCPDFMSNEKDWKFISYEDIAKEIRKTADRVEEDGFEKELICRYSEMLLNLQNVIRIAVNESPQVWVTGINFAGLRTIRMDDIAQKLVASEFVTYLNDKTKSLEQEKNNYKLKIKSDYSHKHATVNVRYVQNIDGDSISAIEIQVEDKEYRWCIQVDKKLNEDETQELFKKYVNEGWFEKYDKDKKIIKGRKTGLTKPFRKYSSEKEKYTLLYQYWTIEDASFESIRKQIVEDMKMAAKLIEKI